MSWTTPDIQLVDQDKILDPKLTIMFQHVMETRTINITKKMPGSQEKVLQTEKHLINAQKKMCGLWLDLIL